ncbi:MAG: DNA helicase RecQ [Muribaculaceae bacterium]|nr:DNA helicase RecQ [Muribaculaceae bacterium]
MLENDKLKEALKRNFGFDTFKGNQLEIIKSLMAGDDVFVLMPTGGGKSLCYQLPALLSEGTAIVISPLIALMKNQVDTMRHYGEDDGVAHFLNSSLSKSMTDKVKKDVKSGETKLLYVAPETFTKEENMEFIKKINISFFAVDEAHCISEWGHDFRPEYRKIRTIINAVGNRPVIALTATATPKVQHDIQKNLGMLNAKIYKSSFNRPNLYYEVRPKNKDIDRDIIKFIKNNPSKSGIIYCLSRKKVEELTETLRINEIDVLPYHAGLDSATRSANQDAFLQEKVQVIVATIAFGMGIDKPDVRFVIHYDIPKSLEGYYQETGRAGRDGGEGRCIAFYSNKDLQKLDKLMQTKSTVEQEIGKHLLAETAAYAESSLCRRRILLHYFGETRCDNECGNCDNCVSPRETIEVGDELCSAIEARLSIKRKITPEYLANILIGRPTDEVKSYGHDSLELFGILKDRDEKFTLSLIRQACVEGYFEKDIENYGFINVSEKGKSFLDSGDSFRIVEDREFIETEIEIMPKAGSGAMDPMLFAMLKDLRKDIARKLNLPPYVIFQETSLECMSTSYPVTLQELAAIPGVGEGKAKRYGEPFINLICKHVEENEIERPEDMRVRSVANKSKLKVALIHCIDRKIDLQEVADSKGLDFGELLDELEAIVEAGTKINIDYFIEEMMDQDHLEEIMEVLKDFEEDDIDDVIEELGEDYTEDEVRLVRVKFLSEMGI